MTATAPRLSEMETALAGLVHEIEARIATDDMDATLAARLDAARAMLGLSRTERAPTPEDLAFREACRPFANAVYSDNGDVTLSFSNLRSVDWVTLRDTAARATPGTPLRKAAQPFLDHLETVLGELCPIVWNIDHGDWYRLKRAGERRDALTPEVKSAAQ